MSRRSVARRAVDGSGLGRHVLNDSVSLVVGDVVVDGGRFPGSTNFNSDPIGFLKGNLRPLADSRRSFLLCNFPATFIATDGVAVLNWIDENNFIEVTCRPFVTGRLGDLSIGAQPHTGLKAWDSVPHDAHAFFGLPRTADELGLGWSGEVVAAMNIDGNSLAGGGIFTTGFEQASFAERSAWAGFVYGGHLVSIRQWKDGSPRWLASKTIPATTGMNSYGSGSNIDLNENPISAERSAGVQVWCYQVPSGSVSRIRVVALGVKNYNGQDGHLGGQSSSITDGNAAYADADTPWSPVGGVMLGRSSDLWNDYTDYGQMGPNGEGLSSFARRLCDASELEDGNLGGALPTPWLSPDPSIPDRFTTALGPVFPFGKLWQARYLGNFKDDYPYSHYYNAKRLDDDGNLSYARDSEYNLPPFDPNTAEWQHPFVKDCPCPPEAITNSLFYGTARATINAPVGGEAATAGQIATAAAPWGAAFQGLQPVSTTLAGDFVGDQIPGEMRTGAEYGEPPASMSDDFRKARGVSIYSGFGGYPLPTSYSEHTTHFIPPDGVGANMPVGVRMRIRPSPRERLLDGSPVALRSFRQWLPEELILLGISVSGSGFRFDSNISRTNYCYVDMGYILNADSPTNIGGNREVAIRSDVKGRVSITFLVGNPANWAAVYGGSPANFVCDGKVTLKAIWSMRLTITESVADYCPIDQATSFASGWPRIGAADVTVRGPMIARSMFEFGGVLMPSTKFASPNMVGPAGVQDGLYTETGYPFLSVVRSILDAPSGHPVPGSGPVGSDGENIIRLSSYEPETEPGVAQLAYRLAPKTSDIADAVNTPNIINNIRVGTHSCRCGFVLAPHESQSNLWRIGHPSYPYNMSQLYHLCHFAQKRAYLGMGEHSATAAYPGTPFGQSADAWQGPESGWTLATDPYCQGRYAELSFSLLPY